MTRVRRVAGLLALAWSATVACPGRTAEPAADLTKEQRAQLESEATKLHEQLERTFASGDLDGAVPLAAKILKLREELYPATSFPKGHADLAGSVKDLATVHRARKEYDKALPLLERALTLYEALYPETRYPQGHADLAGTLNDLGFVHKARGETDKALPYYERALAMCERLYPRDAHPRGHLHVALCVNNLAAAHRARMDYGKALPLHERAVAMFEALYPRPHPYVAKSVGELASLHLERGDYGKALPLLERVLAINEALYPRGHPDLVRSVAKLAQLHRERMDYARALPYQERALALCESLYPKDHHPAGHRDLVESLNELASLQRDRGEYGKALPLLERALAMCQALYPADRFPQGHADLALSFNDLAALHWSLGDYEKALPLYEQALAMRRTLYPVDRFPQGNAALAVSIANLASVHWSQGEYGKALPLYKQALTMRQALYPEDKYPGGHPDVEHNLSDLATVHWSLGDYEKALPLLERALAMSQTLYSEVKYPRGHPDLAVTLNNLAFLHLARGIHGEALPLFERALANYEGFASAVLETSSEAEALNLLASLPSETRDGFLSLPADRVKAEAVYSPVWRGKAALARLLERRHRDALAARDPATRDLFDQLRETRCRLARLLLAPADAVRDSAAEVAKLTAEKERQERELARLLPTTAGREAGTPAELTRRLPPDTAFVDVIQFTRIEWDIARPGEKGKTRTPCYVAFVLTPAGPVRRVDLGPAKSIDIAVAAWRQVLLTGDDGPAGAELRRRVWEPIAKHLPAAARTVYLAPDGALARLPWATLPGSKPGSVLLEDYALAVVPHGSALLAGLAPRNRRPAADGTLVTVGDVAYDRAAPAAIASTDRRGAESTRAAERGAGASWRALAATGPEAAHVAAMAAPRQVVSLSGSDAGVSRLASELPKARWSHLATHGFFADPQFRSAFQLDERLYERNTRDRSTPGARNPLVLSGLVLTGANKPDLDGQGDGGILTAEAIVGLDLSGLDLAVLSACETGLGEVAGGEGVYGLQRAFHIAGCRDVVASLWKVNDQATAALMAVFYRKLWQENLPPIEALRQAQLAIYRHPEQIKELAERGWDTSKPAKLPATGPTTPKADSSKGKAPAKLWAAFVLSGPGRE